MLRLYDSASCDEDVQLEGPYRGRRENRRGCHGGKIIELDGGRRAAGGGKSRSVRDSRQELSRALASDYWQTEKETAGFAVARRPPPAARRRKSSPIARQNILKFTIPFV